MGRSLDLLVLWLIKKIPQLRVKSLNFYDLLFRTTGQRVSRFFFGFRRTKSQVSIYIRRFLLPKKTKSRPIWFWFLFSFFRTRKKTNNAVPRFFFSQFSKNRRVTWKNCKRSKAVSVDGSKFFDPVLWILLRSQFYEVAKIDDFLFFFPANCKNVFHGLFLHYFQLSPNEDKKVEEPP